MATLDDFRVRRATAFIDALKVIGEDLVGEASRRAPIEEGTLRAAGELAFVVNGISYDGPGAHATARAVAARLAAAGNLKLINIVVSFNEVYAAAQHEGVNFAHPLGGQAKYLESVLLERHPRYQAVIHAVGSRA